MGVSWDDQEKFAHVMVAVPDGRILCQRPAHPSFVKAWQATAYRKIPTHCTGTPELAIGAASLVLENVFGLKLPSGAYEHIVSHYLATMNKRLELVVCSMPSGTTIRVPSYLEVVLMTFEQLVVGAGSKRGDFAYQTVNAVNVMGEMWRKNNVQKTS